MRSRSMNWRPLFMALGLSGCAAGPTSPPVSPEPRPGSAAVAKQPGLNEPAASSPEPLPVLVTGVLMRRGGTVEICPGSAYRPCAGIEVVGEVPEAWLSTSGSVAVWRVSGRFDGSKLSPTGAERSHLGDAPSFRNSCAEFQKPMAGQNPDDRLSAEVAAVLAEQAPRVAGHWWDAQHQTMVISVKGDATEVTKLVRARFPKSRICVQQARFSEPELEQARARADRILKEGGVFWSSSAIDVVNNRVVYDAEVLDAPTLAQLNQEVGDAVLVLAFIQLQEHAIHRLPVAPPRGDVVLITQPSRSAASMAALGRFSVHYDAAQRCVYLEGGDGARVLPVWPFGYWATANPFVVHDYDDQPIGKPGQVIEFGGGGVDVHHVRAANSCGAKTAWIGAPQNVANTPRALD